jgi:hypothetical protein
MSGINRVEGAHSMEGFAGVEEKLSSINAAPLQARPPSNAELFKPVECGGLSKHGLEADALEEENGSVVIRFWAAGETHMGKATAEKIAHAATRASETVDVDFSYVDADVYRYPTSTHSVDACIVLLTPQAPITPAFAVSWLLTLMKM